MAYVKNRVIGEKGRLIYDVLKTAGILNKKESLVTVIATTFLIQLAILFYYLFYINMYLGNVF